MRESLFRELIEGKQAQYGKEQCWEWRGARTRAGYGETFRDGRVTYVHRWAYELFKGPLAPKQQIDHLCRNRACFNPDHLESVTCRENLLRGKTKVAENTAKTHCLNGHAFTPENTLVLNGKYGPKRWCRTCKALREWKRRHPGQERTSPYRPYRRQ